MDVLNGRTALICEDEWHTATLLRMVLEKAGMRVVGVVSDGRECAGEVLRERPDVVLMDINLPNVDGTDITRRILATDQCYQPCVIMVTAYADEGHQDEARDAGADAYVLKPFNIPDLIDHIGRLLVSEQCGNPFTPAPGSEERNHANGRDRS